MLKRVTTSMRADIVKRFPLRGGGFVDLPKLQQTKWLFDFDEVECNIPPRQNGNRLLMNGIKVADRPDETIYSCFGLFLSLPYKRDDESISISISQ